MNSRLIVIIISWSALVSFAFWGMTDSLERLGLSRDEAQQLVFSSFGHGSPRLPFAASKIASAERVKIVEDALAFAKATTRSAEFNDWWIQFREGRKPTPPEPPKSMQDMRRETAADIDKQIQELEAEMANASPDQKAIYKQSIETLRQMKVQMTETMVGQDDVVNAAMREDYDRAMQEYQHNLVEWEIEYPVDAKPFIKKRLQQYLDLEKTVDYDAELKVTGSSRTFVNPEYEAKNYLWKYCFRAGRDANAAATRIVRDWFGELQ